MRAHRWPYGPCFSFEAVVVIGEVVVIRSQFPVAFEIFEIFHIILKNRRSQSNHAQE